MVPVLEMKQITKRFPGVVALNKFSIDVRAGEVHALVGENGAGKIDADKNSVWGASAR